MCFSFKVQQNALGEEFSQGRINPRHDEDLPLSASVFLCVLQSAVTPNGLSKSLWFGSRTTTIWV
jgi:hypothetical protein